jgi:enoyl-CoA hydratase/carnithine racemase
MDRVKIRIENHIAVVTFNRPDKMNALDDEQFHAIIAAGKQVSEDPSVRVVVVHGEGRAFCAGLDVSGFSAGDDGLDGAINSRTHGIANKWQMAAWVWRECPVPVIAAVHGVSFGGGLQIMLGADIKYVAADTKLSIMEMKWGLIPDMAGTQLMYHSVRDDIIRELTYTNRIFSGEQAVQYGFATHVSANPLDDAMALAQEIATKSPSAVVKAKKVLNEAPYLNAEDGLMLESVEQTAIIKKTNQLEAVFSSMQKRPGNFEDYREVKEAVNI